MLTLVLILILVFGCVCFKLITPLLYWKKRNIFHVTPWSRFYKVYFQSDSFAETIIEIYNEFPDKRYYGSYQFLEPSLFIRDLELIKQITVKDFEYFTDHQLFTNEKTDPILALNLFSLRGKKWREMRSALSPAFTSSKMKSMHTLISETADNLTHFFANKADDTIELEMKDMFSKFTNDVIATCAFGIKCNSLEDENNEFYKRGKFFAKMSTARLLRSFLAAFFPKFCEFFNIPVVDRDIAHFFLHLVRDSIKQREDNNIVRPDLIHLLMEARKGRLGDDDNITTAIDFTDDVITAQAIVFFIAGFTTASSVMSFMSYELATNPEIQEKLQQEIDGVAAENDGNLTYEDLQKMKYLDQVVLEALRKYPPGFVINRVCVKDYLIEPKLSHESPALIEKGCLVAIPAIALHYCEDFFSDPKKFDPERFSDENKAQIPSGCYMPFGLGPRNCIGSRFAMLEIKTLMFKLLRDFDIVVTEKSVIPLKLAKSLELSAKGGMWLGLKKRRKI